MTFITQPSNPTPPLHPGPPQAYSNSARCAFDFNWSRKELLPEESAVRSRAYPSPPMSGSPPLPLRSAHEAGGRGEAPNFYATSRLTDGLRGGPTQPSPANIREQISPIITRPYPQEPTTRSPYSYPRPDESGRIVPYPPQHHHGMPQGVSQAPYLNSASSNSEAYPVPDRSQAVESQPFTSPKSQRKTKGHVASACVPCKKAHLRLVTNAMHNDPVLDVLVMGKRMLVSTFSIRKEVGHDYETKEMLDSIPRDIPIPRMRPSGGR
ncbi:hypothetical protein N5P37_003558 [Trichoderma harzianum]|nr:hypothetical protein N5P37_003558 [Trichoderma harzianum]